MFWGRPVGKLSASRTWLPLLRHQVPEVRLALPRSAQDRSYRQLRLQRETPDWVGKTPRSSHCVSLVSSQTSSVSKKQINAANNCRDVVTVLFYRTCEPHVRMRI